MKRLTKDDRLVCNIALVLVAQLRDTTRRETQVLNAQIAKMDKIIMGTRKETP